MGTHDSSPRQSSDDAGETSNAPYRSLRTSCDLCKRMKLKCIRQDRSCKRCIARNLPCETTFVTRRKYVREKRKTTIVDVEDRIKRLELVLTASGIDPDSDPLTEVPDQPSKFTDQLSTLISHGDGVTRFIGASSGFSLFSPQGLRWISEKTGNTDLSQFMTQLARSSRGAASPERNDLLASASSPREPLPPKHITDLYVQCFFDIFNVYSPLFDPATFNHYYGLQFSSKPPQSSSWYACLNIVLCIGSMLLQVHLKRKGKRTTRNGDIYTQEQHWQYYRNACSCFMDLLFKDCDLMSVQALCGMAIIQQATFNPEPCYFLVSSAGRLAYRIGLHRKLDGLGMSPIEIETRRNVFWIVYSLDKDLALRIGHPSIIVDDDIEVDMPPEANPLDQGLNVAKTFNIFYHMIQLAQLQSRTFSELYSIRSRNKPALERLHSIAQLDKALQEWREMLPIEIRPGEDIQCSYDQYTVVFMMHFAYLNCLTTIHRIAIHHSSWTNDKQGQDISPAHSQRLRDQVEASEAICLTTARNTIELLQCFGSDNNSLPDELFCMILHHPLSGFLTLFANILQDPQGPTAATDLQLMRIVTIFISPVVTEESPFTLVAAIRLLRQLEMVATQLLESTNSRALLSTTAEATDATLAHTTTFSASQNVVDPPIQPIHVNPEMQSIGSFYMDPLYPHTAMPTCSSDVSTPHTQSQCNTNDHINSYDFIASGISPPPNVDFSNPMVMSETPIFSEYFEWGLTNLLKQPPFQDGY